MAKNHATVELHQIDPALIRSLRRTEQACLVANGLIAAAGLLGSAVPSGDVKVLTLGRIGVDASIAIAACTAGLGFMSLRKGPGSRIVAFILALVTALPGLKMLVSLGATGRFSASPNGISAMVALVFLFLAVALGFLRTAEGFASYIADAAVFGAGWIVLSLVFGYVLGALKVLGAARPEGVAPAMLCALTLLAFVSFARRAEHGHFSIFLGRGIGSRVARGILPVLLILPVLRETGRARIMRTQMLPGEYAAGLLSAAGSMIGLTLLVLIGRQLRRLEEEIRDLSLRDELTGLYNLRGFQLLARQALKLAQRSKMPFSVLYVDVDDLKNINDERGHAVGSRLLVETAEFLQSHFRESDVVARIGGDEFALAGNFAPGAIETAAGRLRLENGGDHGAKQQPRLSLSIGYVSTDPGGYESLEDLLDRADAAMYEQKRRKKLNPAGPAGQLL